MAITASRILLHARAARARPGQRRTWLRRLGLRRTLRAGIALLVRMHQMATTRRMLAEADARTLADLGISAAQARFEAARRPWDWKGVEAEPPLGRPPFRG